MLFCKQHNLEADMIDVLADSIRQSIAYSKTNIKEKDPVIDITPQYSEVLYTEPCTLALKEK